MTEKLKMKKYDPVAKKHVEFGEVQDQVAVDFGRKRRKGAAIGRPFCLQSWQ